MNNPAAPKGVPSVQATDYPRLLGIAGQANGFESLL